MIGSLVAWTLLAAALAGLAVLMRDHLRARRIERYLDERVDLMGALNDPRPAQILQFPISHDVRDSR